MKLYYLGDLISLIPVSNKVVKSCNRGNKKDEMVIGICIEDKNKHNHKCDDKNKIVITDTGVVDVNVTGLVCLGDKLTASNIPGKAKAIRYERLDENQYNIRSIGKVIGVYDTYDKVKVMLDIE